MSHRGTPSVGVAPSSRWAAAEGLPFPLGATWIEEEDAYNFALYSKHAESATLLLTFEVPEGACSEWRRVIDTNSASPLDFLRTRYGEHARLVEL